MEEEESERFDLDLDLEAELNDINIDDDDDTLDISVSLLMGNNKDKLTVVDCEEEFDLNNLLVSSNGLFSEVKQTETFSPTDAPTLIYDHTEDTPFICDFASVPISATDSSKSIVELTTEEHQILIDLMELMVQAVESVPVFFSKPVDPSVHSPSIIVSPLINIADEDARIEQLLLDMESEQPQQTHDYDERFHNIHDVERSRNETTVTIQLDERNDAIKIGEQMLHDQIEQDRLQREERVQKRLEMKLQAVRLKMTLRLQCWMRCILAKRFVNSMRSVKLASERDSAARQAALQAEQERKAAQYEQQLNYKAHNAVSQVLQIIVDSQYGFALVAVLEEMVLEDRRLETIRLEKLAVEREIQNIARECTEMSNAETETRNYLKNAPMQVKHTRQSIHQQLVVNTEDGLSEHIECTLTSSADPLDCSLEESYYYSDEDSPLPKHQQRAQSAAVKIRAIEREKAVIIDELNAVECDKMDIYTIIHGHPRFEPATSTTSSSLGHPLEKYWRELCIEKRKIEPSVQQKEALKLQRNKTDIAEIQKLKTANKINTPECIDRKFNVLQALHEWRVSHYCDNALYCGETSRLVLNSTNKLTTKYDKNQVSDFRTEQLTDLLFLRDYRDALQSLTVSVNCIKSLDGIERLVSLQELHANDNQISDITCLSQLRQLKVLNLGQNNITDVSALCTLTQLRELSLFANKLTELPQLQSLVSLQRLVLTKNNITCVPNDSNITLPPSITHLDLSNNNMTFLSGDVLSTACMLQVLVLTNNKLTCVPSPLKLPLLKELWLNSNELINLDAWQVRTECTHETDNNGIKDNKEHTGEEGNHYQLFLPMLTKLLLQSNHITSINDNIFSTLPLLREVDLSFNNITTREQLNGIREAISLYSLKINDNPVSVPPPPTIVPTVPIHLQHTINYLQFIRTEQTFHGWLVEKCKSLRIVSDVELNLTLFDEQEKINRVLETWLFKHNNHVSVKECELKYTIDQIQVYQQKIAAMAVKLKQLARKAAAAGSTQQSKSDEEHIEQGLIELQYLLFLAGEDCEAVSKSDSTGNSYSNSSLKVTQFKHQTSQLHNRQSRLKRRRIPTEVELNKKASTIQRHIRGIITRVRVNKFRRRMNDVGYDDPELDEMFNENNRDFLDLGDILQSVEHVLNAPVGVKGLLRNKQHSFTQGGSATTSQNHSNVSSAGNAYENNYNSYYDDKPSSAASVYDMHTPRPMSTMSVESIQDTPHSMHSNSGKQHASMIGMHQQNMYREGSFDQAKDVNAYNNIPTRAWQSPANSPYVHAHETQRGGDRGDREQQQSQHVQQGYRGGNVRTGANMGLMPPPTITPLYNINPPHSDHNLTPRSQSQEEYSVNSDQYHSQSHRQHRTHSHRVVANVPHKPVNTTVSSGSFGGPKHTIRTHVNRHVKRPAWMDAPAGEKG